MINTYLRAPIRLRVVPQVLSTRRVSPFLAWGDFHARSTVPEEKWGTTRSLRANILPSIYTVYK